MHVGFFCKNDGSGQITLVRGGRERSPLFRQALLA